MQEGTGQEQHGGGDYEKRLELANRVFDAQLRLYSAVHDKATAYTNLILALGYAGFFGLWSITKPYLDKVEALLAASAVLVSLLVFVGFEIYKATLFGLAMRRRAAGLLNEEFKDDPEAFIAEVNRIEARNSEDHLRQARVWAWAFATSVLFGLAGMGALLYSLVSGLVKAVGAGAGG